MASRKPRRKRGRNRPSVPGLHVNLIHGAMNFTVPASDEPTVVRVAKIPKATNKLAIQASKPVEVRR